MSHSIDVRRRIVKAVQHKGYSLRQATETFEVSKSSVERWLRRYRREGNVTPRVSPGRPSGLPEHQEWMSENLLTNDLTHQARCDACFEHSGIHVSTATLSRLW